MAPVDQPVDILPDEDAPLRVPRAADGLQVNFCKNPVCKNYGVPAKQGTRTGKGPSKDRDPNYAISGLGRNEPGFKCKGCGEIFPPKSNVAIQAEYQRLGSYLLPYNEPSCKNPACKNHERGVFSYPDEYASFGKTSSGNPRFRCKRCHKTFSYAKTSTHRQRKSTRTPKSFGCWSTRHQSIGSLRWLRFLLIPYTERSTSFTNNAWPLSATEKDS